MHVHCTHTCTNASEHTRPQVHNRSDTHTHTHTHTQEGRGLELEMLSTQIAPNGNSGGKKKKAKNRSKKAVGAEGGGESFGGEAVGCVGGDGEGRKKGSD